MSAANAVSNAPGHSQDLTIAGLQCRFDSSGALYLVASRTLLVADLHLEKGSSLARRGSFLPPYDTTATLGTLAEVIERYEPRRVIALGDSFHDRFGPDRLLDRDRASLARLVSERDWIWVLGNHDPALPEHIGGRVADVVTEGAVTLRHTPSAGSEPEIAGHLHPVARIVLHGRGVRVRAAISDGRRCVLPAFGAYAGGLNACDRAFAPMFPDGFTAYAIGRSRIFTIACSALCDD